MKTINIAIDGPAGSGKSVVSRAVAQKLDILYLDTGAMYRAVAYTALQAGISAADTERVVAHISGIDVEVDYGQDRTQRVFVNGEDVTPFIRSPEVSKAASDMAVIPEVRIKLVEKQRAIAHSKSIVLDGRDIGSYVLPNADFKFYMTADSRERARRRLCEIQAKGVDLDKTLDEMTAEIEARDKTDSTREFAPLTCVKDAVFIDTTGLTIGDVTKIVLGKILEARKDISS